MIMSAFQVLNYMENPVDYRPRPQYLLFNEDECFDFRFSAFNRTRFHYMAFYNDINRISHRNLFKNALKAITCDDSDSDIVDFISIKSHLSWIDQHEMILSLENQFDSSCNKYGSSLFVNYNYNDYKSTSAHQVYVDICSIIDKKRLLLPSSQRITIPASDDMIISKTSTKSSLLAWLKLHTLSLKEISQSLDDLPPTLQYIIIAINNFDMMNSEIVEEMVRGLAGFDVKVIIIGISKIFSAPLARMSHHVLPILHIKEYITCTPIEIYDRFLHVLLTMPRLGPALPAGLIHKLYCAFQEEHMCVYTTIQWIIYMIERHFLLRKGLLCMFEDIPWLIDMSIYKHISKKTRYTDDCVSAISNVMALFGADDVAGSGLKLALAGRDSRSDEEQLAEHTVMSICYRRKIDRCLLDCMMLVRDNLLQQQSIDTFSSTHCWLEIVGYMNKRVSSTSSSSSSKKLKPEGIPQSTMMRYVEAICHASMHTPLSILVDTFNEVFNLIHSIDVFPDLDLTSKYLPAYKDMLASYHRQLAILLVIASEDKHIIDARSLNLTAAKHAEIHHRYETEWLETKQVSEAGASSTSTSQPMLSSVRLFVDELISSFDSFINSIQSIPRPTNSLPAMLEIDVTSFDYNIIQGSLRMSTMSAVNNPHDFAVKHVDRMAANSNKFITDTSILSKVACQIKGKKTIFDVHKEFVAVAKPWESKAVAEYFNKKKRSNNHHTNNNSNASQKRKVQKKDDDQDDMKVTLTKQQQDELMNSRFTYAVHDLVKVGLVEVKASKPGVDSSVSIIRNAFALTEV